MTTRTTVTIIDVNLGNDVRAIIANDLDTITAKNQADIDAAIAESRQLTRVRENRQQVAQALTTKIDAAYEALLAADERGETVAATDLLTLVQPEVANLNSLVQRLRATMKARNDPRQLAKMKAGGATYYYLAEGAE